jgi:hypothetical protein
MTDEQGIQDLVTQLEKGIDPFAVIGRLYVQVLAKDKALALAIETILALTPKETPKDPEPPTEPTVYASPDDLPPDAPEGTVAIVGGPTHGEKTRRRKQ